MTDADNAAAGIALPGPAAPSQIWHLSNNAVPKRRLASQYWSLQSVGALSQDVDRHRSMLVQSMRSTGVEMSSARSWPMFYIKITADDNDAPLNSSRLDVATAARDYYERLEGSLSDLEAVADGEEAPVERGALVSARALLREAKSREVAPPELTWQGGDTILMLWAFTSTTLAVTVTEGEVGYVIRRDRKQIALRHSIPLNEFDFLAIR